MQGQHAHNAPSNFGDGSNKAGASGGSRAGVQRESQSGSGSLLFGDDDD